MHWKTFILGAAFGAVSGYATNKYINAQSLVSAEKVLDHAKKLFKQHGSISGSWIHMKAEDYAKNNLTYQVYKGGISRKSDSGEREQFEFIADAKTGTLLDIYSI
jgi:predicted small secreted protein